MKYAAHPYLWMSKAKSRSTGLGMVSEGLELLPEELPEIEEEHIKIYPMVQYLHTNSEMLPFFFPNRFLICLYSCGRTP